jgi:hypothetical protein
MSPHRNAACRRFDALRNPGLHRSEQRPHGRACVHRVDRQGHRGCAPHAIGRFGEVWRARDHVGAHIRWQVEVVAGQIGDQQRRPRRPPFMFGVGLDDSRARRVQAAAQHEAIAPAAQGVVQGVVREREKVGLPGRVLRVPRVAPVLAEAVVRRHASCAGDVRHQSVEYDAAGNVLIEAQVEEVAQVPTRLRDAEADGPLHGTAITRRQRIGRGPACASRTRPRRA